MYIEQSKKMLNTYLLDILRKYSDENHRLSQAEILQRLERDYSMTVDRKTIKRNLMDLIEFDKNICFTEKTRKNKYGEEETVYSEWYIERDFSDAELRLLIDSILFSKHIPYNQCKELIEKLKTLSNIYFNAKVKHICNMPENMPSNKELFYTIDILDEAISKNNQVSFLYTDYDIDKQKHPRKNNKGEIRTYIINPYQIVATNGRYYLICNYDKYDDLSNYRLDRIKDIKLLDTHAKPIKKIKGLEQGLNLPKHMAEHIYMFAGESVNVKFRAQRYIVNEIIDWFGMDVNFSSSTDTEVDVWVKVNEKAFFYWAIQYAEHITVLEPQSVVDIIKKTILNIKNNIMINNSKGMI